jgi:uncharacterized protein (TIGR03437 family)
MIDSDPNHHGSGSVIRNSVVQQGVFSRGIWLSGVSGVSVHDNWISQTSKVGIFVQQLSAPPGSGNLLDTAPSSNVTIQNNYVDSAISYGGISTGPLLDAASIQVMSESGQGGQVSSNPNTNITIQNNLISNSPRSGIRVENVASGQAANNNIIGYGLAATSNVYNAPSCCETLAQYEADFRQPVIVMSSTGFSNSSNTSTTDAGTLIAGVSAASYSAKVAPGSLVTAFWNNPKAPQIVSPQPWQTTLGGLSVSVTDSAGVGRLAPIYYFGLGQFSFQVPESTATGLAAVTVGSFTGRLLVDSIAPSLYSQDGSGRGVAAATWALYPATGNVTTGFVATIPCPSTGCVAAPIDLGGTSDLLYLTLYGTGLKAVTAQSVVRATIGGFSAKVAYIGPQGLAALDQVNLLVPHSLAGAGEVPIVLSIDGQTANVVTARLK